MGKIEVEIMPVPEMHQLVGRMEELCEARVVAVILSGARGQVMISTPREYRRTVIEALKRTHWEDFEDAEEG